MFLSRFKILTVFASAMAYGIGNINVLFVNIKYSYIPIKYSQYWQYQYQIMKSRSYQLHQNPIMILANIETMVSINLVLPTSRFFFCRKITKRGTRNCFQNRHNMHDMKNKKIACQCRAVVSNLYVFSKTIKD